MAAEGGDWPEVARLLLSHADAWPGDAAFLLEAARWLRMAGYGDRAGGLLNRAAQLGDSHGLTLEAEALEWPLARPLLAAHPATILLDIHDLLQFLHDNGSVSGIQRVQLGILGALLDGEAGPEGVESVAVFPSLADGALWAPPAAALRAIVAHCTGPGLNHARLRRLVADARMRALRVTPAAGSAFVILGAFWFYAGAPRFFLGLRAAGIRIGVLIYDMFPATHPECTTADTRQYFMQALAEGLPFWDFAFAISEYSAAAFRQVAAARGAHAIETVAIPLAHSFDLAPLATPAWLDTWPAALGDLRGREFILAVSTIEVRKNHLLLFHAWKRMIEAGDNPPTLVLVGRPGWGVGDLMMQLQATRWLDGRIMIVHGLSDAALAALYRACLFTVMPSFAEGWGLAVGESLSFGKPCIAAEGSALAEVGGDLVTYADAGSVPQWVAALRLWLRDRDALAAAAARIGREFVPRRWPEVARHLLAETTRLRAAPPAPTPEAKPLRLVPGRVTTIGQTDLSAPGAAAVALAQSMSLEAGWHPLEAGLCWMRGRSARFVISTDLPPGAEAHLRFDLATPPWPGDNELLMTSEGSDVLRCHVRHGAALEVAVAGRVAADGAVHVRFQLVHPPAHHAEDTRGLCVGLTAVTLIPPVAATARQPSSFAEPDRRIWVDLSSLCTPSAEIWSARRWRLGLAQAIFAAAGTGWAAVRGEGLVRVPRDLAMALLSAPPGAREAMLVAARGGLPALQLGQGDRLLTMGLAADNTPARMARRGGALVTLLLACTAALLRPHRAPDQAAALRSALFDPHSPFDAVLLAREDAAAAAILAAQGRALPWGVLPQARSAVLPWLPAGTATPCLNGGILVESWEPVVAESWSLLAAPPPHMLQADDSVPLEALLGGCRLVLAPNLAGAWPGLARAAEELGVPWLSPDPTDARASAVALQAALSGTAAIPATPGGVAWEEVALAALRFDPMRPAAPGPVDPPPPVTPAMSEAWAMAATRRP